MCVSSMRVYRPQYTYLFYVARSERPIPTPSRVLRGPRQLLTVYTYRHPPYFSLPLPTILVAPLIHPRSHPHASFPDQLVILCVNPCGH